MYAPTTYHDDDEVEEMCEHLNAGMIKVQKKDIFIVLKSRDIWYKRAGTADDLALEKPTAGISGRLSLLRDIRLTVAKLYIAIRCIETQPGINPMGMCTTTRLT